MNIQRVAVVIILTVLISACVPQQITLSSNQEVKLKINGTPALTIFSPGNNKCKRQNKGPGCIYVAENQFATIEFRLLQSAQWHLETFEVCYLQEDGDKDNRDCELTDWDRLEFAAVADGGTIFLIPDIVGKINLTYLGEDHQLSDFTLYNQNSVPQEYFYRVKACKNVDEGEEEDECLWTDPPIENRGRGRR